MRLFNFLTEDLLNACLDSDERDLVFLTRLVAWRSLIIPTSQAKETDGDI
jgi:hypothetical protein